MLDDLSGSRHDGAQERRARYRALLLGSSGEIIALTALTARDDDDAMQIAGSMVDGRAVELWDGLRFIERFDPVD